MTSKLEIVTHCTDVIDTEIDAWTGLLGYRLVLDSSVPESLGNLWDASDEVGCRMCLLQPPVNGGPLIRFVQTGLRPGYLPGLSWGWNAIEILVEDPDRLSEILANSAFASFYGPADLTDAPNAPRVLQTKGPSGELVYFTRIVQGTSRYGLQTAKGFVDRVFNIVVGGPSLEELQAFYQDSFGFTLDGPTLYRGTLAAKASGDSDDSLYPISVGIVEPERSIIELDQFFATTQGREYAKGQIPGGFSMVSMSISNFDDFIAKFRAPPQVAELAPYFGRRAAVTIGPAGEWIELIDSHQS